MENYSAEICSQVYLKPIWYCVKYSWKISCSLVCVKSTFILHSLQCSEGNEGNVTTWRYLNGPTFVSVIIFFNISTQSTAHLLDQTDPSYILFLEFKTLLQVIFGDWQKRHKPQSKHKCDVRARLWWRPESATVMKSLCFCSACHSDTLTPHLGTYSWAANKANSASVCRLYVHTEGHREGHASYTVNLLPNEFNKRRNVSFSFSRLCSNSARPQCLRFSSSSSRIVQL